MSILTENSKKMLVESMRECLSEVLHESTSLTSKQATEKIKFVTESATYEQLLNITLNPHRQEKYQPAYVLEGAVAILHSACMTERKHIGINAITEGALKLQKKTGAVITESMLDAALTAVNEGAGLKVVGKLLTESLEGQFNQIVSGWLKHANIPEYDSTALNNAIATAATPADRAAAIAAKNTARNTALQKLFNTARTNPGALPPDLIRHLGGIDNVKQLQTGGKDVFQQATKWAKIDQLKRQISSIQSRHARMAPNAISQAEKDQLLGLQRKLSKATGSSAGGMPSTGNIAKDIAKKTPWGKYALGAAAIGGLGALGYQYYKNRKAMNRDIQNGIEQ